MATPKGDSRMTIAEYISVLLAILVGLAIADLATSFHKLMRARDRVQWDWMSLALALVMLLETILFWWGSFQWYRATSEISIGAFLPDLGVFLLLFLAVAAVLPDDVPAAGLSMRDYYFATAPYFWTLMVLMSVLVAFGPGLRYVEDLSWTGILRVQWPNLALGVAMVPLIVTRRSRVHMGFVAFLVVYTLWVTFPYILR